MFRGLTEKDWDTLLWRIEEGKCTPFLGAGACSKVLPLGSNVARKWAEEEDYPLADRDDLARVAQFLAVDRGDPMYPKEKIVRSFKNVGPPDFDEPDEIHGVLADIPLPIYITTNYDDFMLQALKNRNKEPKQEICRWNKYIKDQPSIFESDPQFKPNPANPVVFHLHGHMKVPESLVLTEDDYLDFLVNISRDPTQSLLPPRIKRAMSGASLLFIGYRLADWNFRVLYRGLVGSLEQALRRIGVAVQLPPPDSEPGHDKTQDYLNKYFGFGNKDVKVYWGTAEEFAKDLRERWKDFQTSKKGLENDA